ncbi:MAG: GMC oxidoreductase [Pseudomonadota bacterium]
MTRITEQDVFDYIVVGAGTSGCVVASRLAEDPNVKVLLLEAGGPDNYDVIEYPAVPNLFLSWQDPRIAHDFPMQQHAFGESRWPQVPWPAMRRGRVRGGSHSINGMVYIRGNRRDFDLWASLGNPGWSFDEVLPYFKKSEDFQLGADTYHGGDGPMPVRLIRKPTEVARAFCETGPTLGFAGPDWDFNGPQQEGGTGTFQFTRTANGRRASTAYAFIESQPAKPNLVEHLTAHAARLVFEGNRAVGVDCLIDDSRVSARPNVGQSFRAREEIIVCAGAIESPKLLMLSGLGRPERLRQLGIPCQYPLPGVGQNLIDHLLVVMFFESHPGLMGCEVTAESCLFTYTSRRSRALAPDLQYHVSGKIDAITPPVFPKENFIVCPTLVQPESIGFLDLMSNDPRHDPYIQPHYLQTEQDIRVLYEGIELAREFANASPLKEFNRGELKPGKDADLVKAIKEQHITVWHPVGTCKMGRDGMSVVDPELRVYGVDGLRVADASIMPTIPAGNVNAACAMVAEKVADLIRFGRG